MSVRVMFDGRTIFHGPDYTANKKSFIERQGGKCADCGRDLPDDLRECHFHHYAGRGLGGGKRDDLDPRNRVLCPFPCHARYDEKPQWGKA